ncbi:helix-turn-helix transcriptional regulator [Christensenellaceae bacterium OttesenSCG-928-K19]|nr:helix-turn-helix transcriptional regulator [Christensenellaceae bacterium OttesenSCG-928-K19]
MATIDFDEQVKEHFSNKMKKLRKEAEQSQEEFGAQIGISRSAVGYYENKERAADITVLARIADRFQVSSDYLLGRTDNPKNNKVEQIVDDSLRELELTAQKSTQVYFPLILALRELGKIDFGVTKTEFLYGFLSDMFQNLAYILQELHLIGTHLEQTTESYKKVFPDNAKRSDDELIYELTQGRIGGFIQNCHGDLMRLLDTFTKLGTLRNPDELAKKGE